MNTGQIVERASSTRMARIVEADRDEFAVALVLQGFSPPRAHEMAYETVKDNDGALQMLARRRIAVTEPVKTAALNLLNAYGGDVPDWLRTEYDALAKACADADGVPAERAA